MCTTGSTYGGIPIPIGDNDVGATVFVKALACDESGRANSDVTTAAYKFTKPDGG
jgi:hypothetical protein